mmetsp:Transcript_10605/g.14966  ORF Transcript_10605/g.14966 Transcript_10605/m.14966 type:complete len:949 (+) Transcript_10605:19-2865(+)
MASNIGSRRSSILISLVDTFLPPLSLPHDTGSNKCSDVNVDNTILLGHKPPTVKNESEMRFWSTSLVVTLSCDDASNDDNHSLSSSHPSKSSPSPALPLSSSQTIFLEKLIETIEKKLLPHDRFSLLLFLYLSSTIVGSFLFFLPSPIHDPIRFLRHTFNIFIRWKNFSQWTLDERIAALQDMRDSRFETRRAIFTGLKRLICGLAFTYLTLTEEDINDRIKNVSPMKINPFWEAMSYPGPIHWYHRSMKDTTKDEKEESSSHVDDNHESSSSDSKYMDSEKMTITSHFNQNDALLNLDSLFAQKKNKMKINSNHPRNQNDPEKNFKMNAGDDLVLEYDVVIIGSGAGGSVAASSLTQHKHSVLVLEKGPYIPPSEISNTECEALDRSYERHGLCTSSNGNIMILAGSTVGGGTTINWGCCLDTPSYVREEWADKFGLEQFRNGSEEYTFDESLKYVKHRIGSTSPTPSSTNDAIHDDAQYQQHNRANKLFLKACKNMRYVASATGNNFVDPTLNSAGYTTLGDKYGNKQGTLVTFLKDAIKNGQGRTKILENCTVERILHDKYNCNNHDMKRKSSGRKAVGVLAKVKDNLNNKEYSITILAKKCVILSAGSLNTPCVMLRSGFKNPNIGKHLRLHPATGVIGTFSKTKKNSTKSSNVIKIPSNDNTTINSYSSLEKQGYGGNIEAYLGAPMTSVCGHFEQGPKQNGYGAKIEVPSVHTGTLSAAVPWKDPISFKRKLLEAKNSLPLVILQRDTGVGGRVLLGPDRFHPKIDYLLSSEDVESMLEAMVGCVKLLIAAGADKIYTLQNDDEGLEYVDQIINDDDINDMIDGKIDDIDVDRLISNRKQIVSYLNSIHRNGIAPHQTGIFSAHQMGSCRMGTSPLNSVVDENGETWECDNLFIMDTSVFPTASGSNPMITALTISHMLSTRLAKKLANKTFLKDVNINKSY